MKYWLGILCLLLMSCSKKSSGIPEQHFGNEPYDSTALHVALIPVKDCLPVYYAAQKGIYERLGLKLQIASYVSQIDCDTALLGRYADGGFSDRIRLASYGKCGQDFEVLWNADLKWQLWVSGSLRVRNAAALRGRTIAVPRQSSERAWLEQVIVKAGIPVDEIYCPQINALLYRARMLTGNQIDATLLCWPYNVLAATSGHRKLLEQSVPDSTVCFVRKSVRVSRPEIAKKWQLFEKGRKMAIDSLRLQGPSAYSDILQREYGLPKEIADTIRF